MTPVRTAFATAGQALTTGLCLAAVPAWVHEAVPFPDVADVCEIAFAAGCLAGLGVAWWRWASRRLDFLLWDIELTSLTCDDPADIETVEE